MVLTEPSTACEAAPRPALGAILRPAQPFPGTTSVLGKLAVYRTVFADLLPRRRCYP